MIKILILGDLHIQLNNPRNRIDSLKDAITTKFKEITEIIADEKIDYIICTGDIFNSGQVSNNILLFAEEIFSKITVPIFTTPGNHDLFNFNASTYRRTSLFILEKLIPNLKVFFKEDYHDIIDTYGNKARLTFHEFSNELDNGTYNGYKTSHMSDMIIIHTVHGMLLDHIPPFSMFTLIHKCVTNAGVVISGHDHTGYGIQIKNATTFINPGSLLRSSASKTEISRKVKVGILKLINNKVEANLVELKCQKPGSEVLDRSVIEAATERAYAMDQFSMVLKDQDVNFQLNILDVYDQIAAIECAEKNLIKKVRDQLIIFMEENDGN